jgi:hypothetical protein
MAPVSSPQLLARRWLTLAAGLWMQVCLFYLDSNSECCPLSGYLCGYNCQGSGKEYFTSKPKKLNAKWSLSEIHSFFRDPFFAIGGIWITPFAVLVFLKQDMNLTLNFVHLRIYVHSVSQAIH